MPTFLIRWLFRCTPTYTAGTTDGDYINGVSLGAINNQNSAASGGPGYNNYTSMSTAITINEANKFTVNIELLSNGIYYLLGMHGNSAGKRKIVVIK